MKKFVLLCTILAALCCMAYAETLTDDAAYTAAKERYYLLYNKMVDGSATYAESVEFGDLCQVYSLEFPAKPEEERDRGNLDDGGGDCDNATEIPECPYYDTGTFDGDNDCSVPTAAPSNEVFYRFVAPFTGGYQLRVRNFGTVVPGVRVVTTACCTGATNPPNWFYSSGSVAMDCNEPSTVVTYLYVYLTEGQTYWIHVGTSSSTVYTTNYEFNLWCIPCPPMEPAEVHNTCATAFEIQCGDSIFGDSAVQANPDWYKIVVPDYSPLLCSLRVFVGGRELGHCISGKYPAYTSAPLGAVDGRASIWREQDGNPCVLDSIRKIDDEGCSFDAKGAILATPGTYYVKVWNFGVNDYVMTTQCFTFDPIAACCFLDGSCQNLVAAECALAGGWSKPIGVLCDPNPCPAECQGDRYDDELVNNVCGPDVPEVVCDGWYCGVIPMPSDSDWYKFIVPEGVCETLWVDIYGNDTPSQFPFNQGLDPVVRLFKSDCVTQLGINYDNNGVDPLPVGDDSRLKYTITRPGTYYIKVHSEYNLVGPYRMHITCTPFECPDLTGDVCEDPRVINALPFSETHTTCNYTNDYNPTTCLGTYYGTGPDVIYKLTLDGYSCFACSLSAVGSTGGSPYASISLWNACPTTTGACIASDVSSPYAIQCQGIEGPLPAGDYYIMIDNWPSPPCINYTLYVYPCDCPSPCPYPNRDNEAVNNACATTTEAIACQELLCGNISASTDVDWYSFTIPTGECDCVWVDVYGNDTQGQWPYGKGLDPVVSLYKADCVTLIGTNDDIGGSPWNDDSRYHPLRCLVAGTYYIKVACYSTYIGPYVLGVTCMQCECPPPCETYTLCGAPGEVEVNNTCPPPVEQPEILCNTTVYGLHCPTVDTDFWKVTIAPMSIMTIKVYTGPACDVNPAVGVQFRYYNDLCASPTGGVTGSVVITNNTESPVVKYLEVYDVGESQTLYKVEATCCQITDYCANPIYTGAGIGEWPSQLYRYSATVNTCCATNVVDTIWSTGCGTGSKYASGNDVVFKFILATSGVVSCSVRTIASGDGQFTIFTDCANPKTSCVVSRDAATGTSWEVVNNLILAAGTYYVAVSNYTMTACGNMEIRLSADIPLPVELMGDVVATPGNEKVTLSWATASETNNARFEIVRDGRVIGQVEGAGTSTTRRNYTWSEDGLNNGTSYAYTLRSVNVNEYAEVIATVEAIPSFAAGEVTEYALHQNYPNPFNPTTNIAFDLLEAGNVTLKIYNLMGQEVKTVVSGSMPQGRHIVSFDAANLSSGIYLYRIEVNNFVAEKKMLLMK